MIYGLYVIRDVKSTYGALMIYESDAVAARQFESDVQRSNGVLHTHYKDFNLYCLGSYNTDNATILTDTPRLVIEGVDCYV